MSCLIPIVIINNNAPIVPSLRDLLDVSPCRLSYYRYGRGCYRTSPEHKAKYSHPPADGEEEKKEEEEDDGDSAEEEVFPVPCK